MVRKLRYLIKVNINDSFKSMQTNWTLFKYENEIQRNISY